MARTRWQQQNGQPCPAYYHQGTHRSSRRRASSLCCRVERQGKLTPVAGCSWQKRAGLAAAWVVCCPCPCPCQRAPQQAEDERTEAAHRGRPVESGGWRSPPGLACPRGGSCGQSCAAVSGKAGPRRSTRYASATCYLPRGARQQPERGSTGPAASTGRGLPLLACCGCESDTPRSL